MTDRVMIDIESMGLDPGASIVSIGAVRFGPKGLDETFFESISLTSCEHAGLSIDAETVEWWLAQDELAKEQLTGGHRLEPVLEEFAEWLGGADEIWANSPSFDCELLEAAYDAVGMDAPWSFYEERDFRTLSGLDVAPDIDNAGVEHDALDDAKAQAEVAAETLHRLETAEIEVSLSD
ncbi:hypothetical protein DJ71_04880 [Halorubrum sp. E3]|nr:hypothetical protein DJ71_04880 [Halorubrum sp. E3]